jgi:hypothetical protein
VPFVRQGDDLRPLDNGAGSRYGGGATDGDRGDRGGDGACGKAGSGASAFHG